MTEDELHSRAARLERQIREFRIVNPDGNVSGGFGPLMGIARNIEERIANIEKSFAEFQLIGGEGVKVAGGIGLGGYTIEAKIGVTDSDTGGGGGGPTPTGACCIGTDCHILTSADCATMGGTYQGDDVPCDPNPCLPPTGACCSAIDFSCSILTATDCAAQSGTYQGDDTLCSPNPCPICCCGILSLTLSAEISWTKTCENGEVITVTATIPEQTFTFDCTGSPNYGNSFSTGFSSPATITCAPDCDPMVDFSCVKTANAGAAVTITCNTGNGSVNIGFGSSLDTIVRCNLGGDEICFLDSSSGVGSEITITCDGSLLGTHDVIANATDWSGTTTFHVTIA